MKTLMIVLFAAIINFSGYSQNSENKVKSESVEFKVYGNCSMCKSRIEKALKVVGINSAVWNKKTGMVKVSYNPSKISVNKMHELVANVGHDTDLITAKDETYDKLHGCCKYERKSGTPEKKKEDKHGNKQH